MGDLQFTGFMRHVDLYTEALSQEVIQRIVQDQQIAVLPHLSCLRVTENEVPLWGDTEDGGYEVLAYIPWNSVVVHLEDVDDQYVRVSYHGLYGYVDRSYLTETE